MLFEAGQSDKGVYVGVGAENVDVVDAASEVDDFHGKVVSHSMDVVRELFRIGMHLVLRLGLGGCQSVFPCYL